MSTRKKTPTPTPTVNDTVEPAEETTNADGGNKEETPRLVKINWTDAFSGTSGWHYLEDYETNSVEPTTIGWLFNNQPLDNYITVYSTYYHDGKTTVVSDPNHIPKGMIKEIQIIQLG